MTLIPNINQWSHSFRKEIQFTFKWTVNNANCGGAEYSPTVASPAFYFYHKGNSNYLNLLLNVFNTGGYFSTCRIDVTVRYHWGNMHAKLYLLDKDQNAHLFGKTIFQASIKQDLSLVPTFLQGSEETEDHKKFKNLAKEDILNILCKISFLETTESSFPKTLTYEMTEGKLNYDMNELFKTQVHCDTTYEVAGRKFNVHKCILASRSKVFAAMFEHDMEEVKSNKVTITDIGPEVFEEMLRYIYTGKVLNLDKVASELLVASDKYDLENLKLMCEQNLISKLSVENAAEILIWSDLYTAKELKATTMNFINVHKNVLNSEGWKKIVSNYNYLLIELYSKKFT